MLKMLMNDDLKKPKKAQSCGLLIQFPTSNPQLHWPEPFPQPSTWRIREGVKLVIFLWRSKKCVNQTFIFETKFSGIKGQGSFLEEFHPISHNQKSTKTNHQFRGWKLNFPLNFPNKKKGPWVGWGTSNCSQSFKISDHLKKTCGGKVDFGWSHRCWKKSPSHSHKKVQVMFVGHHPSKRKTPTNLNQQKKLDFFCESP